MKLFVAIAASVVSGAITMSLAVPGASSDSDVTFTQIEIDLMRTHLGQPALPAAESNRYADDPAAAHLGQFIFFDQRFSSNELVSCSTCHMAGAGFSNNMAHGEGVGMTPRHSPTLWNVAYHRWFNWDGSRDSLWSQALGPFEAPLEMGHDRTAIIRLVRDDRRLRAAYESVFGPMPHAVLGDLPDQARPIHTEDEPEVRDAWDALSDETRAGINAVFVNLGKALSAYQRRLIRFDAPFDRFAQAMVDGRDDAATLMSPAGQRGLKMFLSERVHCRSCHMGPLFSDLEFHNLQLPTAGGKPPRDAGRYEGAQVLIGDPFNAAGEFSDAPEGPTARGTAAVVRSSESWGQFKTPSLRNVSLSPPYMHEGHFDTLADVLEFYSTLEQQVNMGHHQETILVPLNLKEGEKADLEAFLRSLTGRVPDRRLLRMPTSPMLPTAKSAGPALQDAANNR